jgi:hypothetical protein
MGETGELFILTAFTPLTCGDDSKNRTRMSSQGDGLAARKYSEVL